jgi:O-antigen/teichoic acid export membrane protein
VTTTGSDLRRRTIQSLFWQFLGVGGQRIVQLAGPIVLWRLLDEHDLGLFAIVLSGIGIVESLTTFVGEQTQIWSDRGAERRYLDTVFTVRVLRSLLISTILCALAWPLAWFFGNPITEARYWLPGLFLVLAGNGLVDALQSPARAARMKGLDFRRVATGDFVASVLGIGLTLALAFLWRNVWALVVGHLASTTIRAVTSHVVAPHRLRFHLDRGTLRELFHYNKSAAGTPFLLLMVFTAPPIVLGKVIGTGAVAVYDGAARLAKLPEDLFLRVLAPVAIPAYAQLKYDTPRLARAWMSAVHAFLLVGTPMTVVMAWCGDALPSVVFGAKYVAVPGLFALLALHGGLAGLTAVVGPLFWAVGQPQWDRKAQFFRCLVIYGLGIPLSLQFGVLGFAAGACLAIATALAFSVGHALPMLGLRLSTMAGAMQHGLWFGLALGGALLAVDFVWSPAGWWRVLAAGGLGGPLLAFLVLRLLRQRRRQPPAVEAAPSPLDDGV